MDTQTKDSVIPPAVMADMQAVAESLAGVTPLEPEIARRVQARAEKARQELLAMRGVQDIGVQIIRELRGDSPQS